MTSLKDSNIELDDMNKFMTGCKFMVKVPVVRNETSIPEPHPSAGTQNRYDWDSYHVKMPYSEANHMSKTIRRALDKKLKKFADLEKAIKSYNPNYAEYKFDVLRAFFESNDFDKDLFKAMAKFSLDLHNVVTKSVPLLRQNQNCTLFLSQYQIGCLLSNAFFCTFPRRSRPNQEYSNFPTFNFVR